MSFQDLKRLQLTMLSLLKENTKRIGNTTRFSSLVTRAHNRQTHGKRCLRCLILSQNRTIGSMQHASFVLISAFRLLRCQIWYLSFTRFDMFTCRPICSQTHFNSFKISCWTYKFTANLEFLPDTP